MTTKKTRNYDEHGHPLVRIEVELTEDQAWEFAQFLKRAYFRQYRELATNDDEAYTMVHAGEKIRGALAGAGYAPR